MAFWGKTFIFDGISCEEFDLELYNVGSVAQSEGTFAADNEVIEDTVGTSWRSRIYGVKYTDRLTFDIVFGVNQRRVDEGRFLDRYELSTVASWLVNQPQYKLLEIEQDDMRTVRFRCMITGMEIVEYGSVPWALRASVTCDSAYGYMYPQVYEYVIDGSSEILFLNESSHNGYYAPNIEIEPAGDSFSIVNMTDNEREMSFFDLPAAVQKIDVHCENQVITNNADINLYDKCNLKFVRLLKGYNQLKITGSGIVRFICEFPVNVGG